jgi:hypothetical protein
MNERRAVITEAGVSRIAMTRPWDSLRHGIEHAPVQGTLNGKPTDFHLTSGRGFHYAYFNALAQIWCVDTGSGLLSAGAAIEFVGVPWLASGLDEEHYRWRTLWNGRIPETQHYTEDEIRIGKP